MKVQILEVENGISSVFHTLTIDKFMTIEKAMEICVNRNRQFGHENRTYILSTPAEVAA